MDIQKLADVQGLTIEEFVEIADILVTTTQSDIQKIQAAIAENNFSAAAGAAHSIKGAAGNMGFTELSDSAKATEDAAKAHEEVRVMAGISNLLECLGVVEVSLGQQRP